MVLEPNSKTYFFTAEPIIISVYYPWSFKQTTNAKTIKNRLEVYPQKGYLSCHIQCHRAWYRLIIIPITGIVIATLNFESDIITFYWIVRRPWLIVIFPYFCSAEPSLLLHCENSARNYPMDICTSSKLVDKLYQVIFRPGSAFSQGMFKCLRRTTEEQPGLWLNTLRRTHI